MVEFFCVSCDFFWCLIFGAKFETFFFNPPNYVKIFCPPEKNRELDCKVTEKINRKSLIMMNPLQNCVYLVVIIHYGKKEKKVFVIIRRQTFPMCQQHD